MSDKIGSAPARCALQPYTIKVSFEKVSLTTLLW